MGSGRPRNMNNDGMKPRLKKGYKLCPLCGKQVQYNENCTCTLKKAHKVHHRTPYEQQSCPNCRAGQWCSLYNIEFACR